MILGQGSGEVRVDIKVRTKSGQGYMRVSVRYSKDVIKLR